MLAAGGLHDRPREVWELIERAWPTLQRFVLQRLLYGGIRKSLVEDCGQMVMERVWNYRLTYKGTTEGAFWAWLRRICDHERLRMQVRDRKHPIAQTDLDGGLPSEKPTPPAMTGSGEPPTGRFDPTVESAAMQETLNALKECLGELDTKQRLVIDLLFFRAELPERAVAQIMDCSPAYVHKLKRQAVEVIRRCLKNKGFDEA